MAIEMRLLAFGFGVAPQLKLKILQLYYRGLIGLIPKLNLHTEKIERFYCATDTNK
jgi:hypothetical protein